MEAGVGAAGLWLAVLGMGAWHGVNPGMGWPLAVSAALMERRQAALWRALGLLGAGHLAAMLAILLPFGALTFLIEHERALRIGAGVLVIGIGLWLLVTRRHPRFLARVPPHRLALWSFLVATAHGAGLMLVPIYLGLCATADDTHAAVERLVGGDLGTALGVAVAHTLAMVGAGGAIAFAVHRWLGLRVVSRSWLNLDAAWALSLVLVGGASLWLALGS